MPDLTVLPTVAVIPFAYVGEKNSQLDVVGEILANNIISLLSQSLYLRVISRVSTTRFRTSLWSFAEIRQKLGCDFVLRGEYFQTRSGLNIKFQLSDVLTTDVMWEDEIHCVVRDILDSNGYPVNYLANSTVEKIFESGISGYNSDSLDSLETYALYIKAIKYLHANDSEHFLKSKDCFNQILNRHPDNSNVHTLLAEWHLLRLHRKGGWQFREQQDARETLCHFIDKAIELNPGNEFAIATKGVVDVQIFKDINSGLRLIDAALKSNKNDPRIYAIGSLIYLAAHRTEEAVACINTAIELSPLDPQLEHFYAVAAAAHYQADRYAQAEQFAQRSIKLNSIHTSPLRTLIAIQIASGETRLAKTTAQKLMDLEPGFTVESWLKHWSGQVNDGHQFAARLSAAGIPLR